MKKSIFLLLSVIIFANAAISAESTASTTTSLLNELKNAVMTDVTNTVTTSVNSVKLTTYKAQLTQKKKELEELENSSTNVFVKYFKKIQIQQKITELETKISELESTTSTTTTTTTTK